MSSRWSRLRDQGRESPRWGAVPKEPTTATGTVNIIGNTIRNSSEDCVNSAIAYNVYAGRIERNRIIDFVKPCASQNPRNMPGAIWLGLRVTGLTIPPVTPTVRFNDIQGNAQAGLRVARRSDGRGRRLVQLLGIGARALGHRARVRRCHRRGTGGASSGVQAIRNSADRSNHQKDLLVGLWVDLIRSLCPGLPRNLAFRSRAQSH